MKDFKETFMKYVFLMCACVSILAVVLYTGEITDWSELQ